MHILWFELHELHVLQTTCGVMAIAVTQNKPFSSDVKASFYLNEQEGQRSHLTGTYASNF